ncbi:MAG TPA: glycosyltransferase family 39 protein [Williamwhitmania sp.]|nr:glycosyltransferase family 39 protein [Williamwhitmania sp.]
MRAAFFKLWEWVHKHEAALIFIGLFAFSSIWKWLFISYRDICIDEPFTLFHSQGGIVDIWNLSSQNEPNPPLFMLIEHYVIQLFGLSAMAVRLPSVIFSSLTGGFIFLIGKKLFSSQVGIVAALLMIFSSQHFYYGAEARTYALLYMAAAASVYFFFCFAENPQNRRYFWSLILANMVMVYSHYFGWLVIFSEALVVLLMWKNKSLLRSWLLNTALQVLFYAPMWIVMIRQLLISGKGTWVQPPHIRDFYIEMAGMVNGIVAFTLIIILIAAVIIYHFYVSPGQRVLTRNHLYLLVLFIVPYSLLFMVSFKIPMFLARYFLFVSVSFYLLLTALIWSFSRQIGKWRLVPLLLLLVIALSSLKVLSKKVYYREVRKAVAYTDELKRGATLIIIHPNPAQLEYAYYNNRKAFTNPAEFDSLMRSDNILPIWGLNELKEHISEFSFQRIIYFQDGSSFYDSNNEVYHYLDSAYSRVDNKFFPECLNVSAFDVKKGR